MSTEAPGGAPAPSGASPQQQQLPNTLANFDEIMAQHDAKARAARQSADPRVPTAATEAVKANAEPKDKQDHTARKRRQQQQQVAEEEDAQAAAQAEGEADGEATEQEASPAEGEEAPAEGEQAEESAAENLLEHDYGGITGAELLAALKEGKLPGSLLGEQEPLSLEEVNRGRMRHADYTRKTQEAAELRRAASAELARAKAVQAQYKAEFEAMRDPSELYTTLRRKGLGEAVYKVAQMIAKHEMHAQSLGPEAGRAYLEQIRRQEEIADGQWALERKQKMMQEQERARANAAMTEQYSRALTALVPQAFAAVGVRHETIKPDGILWQEFGRQVDRFCPNGRLTRQGVYDAAKAAYTAVAGVRAELGVGESHASAAPAQRAASQPGKAPPAPAARKPAQPNNGALPVRRLSGAGKPAAAAPARASIADFAKKFGV